MCVCVCVCVCGGGGGGGGGCQHFPYDCRYLVHCPITEVKTLPACICPDIALTTTRFNITTSYKYLLT